MAQPAPSLPDRSLVDEEPPLDPDAVSRSYLHHRAQRFWLAVVLVLVVTVVLAARTLGEIERVFGI